MPHFKARMHEFDFGWGFDPNTEGAYRPDHMAGFGGGPTSKGKEKGKEEMGKEGGEGRGGKRVERSGREGREMREEKEK